jgi:predicted dehydrogenase
MTRRHSLAFAALSAQRIAGANSRPRIGMIGVGNIGRRHLDLMLLPLQREGVLEVAAISDVYSKRKQEVAAFCGLAAKDVHNDYQELVSRPGIDAVFVCTPDHWHFDMAMATLRAGKDLYLEKPITLTVPQAKSLTEFAESSKRIVQVGSQYASDDRAHKAREVIAQGEIGQPVLAEAHYCSNTPTGAGYKVESEASASTIDWNRWLGSAPKRPFSAERFFRWRNYWDYGHGIGGDLLYHRLTLLMTALGSRMPQRATASGGIYAFRNREVPDTYATTIDYDKFTLQLSSTMANALGDTLSAPVIHGTKGTIRFTNEGIEIIPERHVKTARRTIPAAPAGHNETRLPHLKNFLSCLSSRQQPNMPPRMAYELFAAIAAGTASYRSVQRPAYEGDGLNPTA